MSSYNIPPLERASTMAKTKSLTAFSMSPETSDRVRADQ